MDSIRIKKDDVYRIEVNDNGDYIEFDLLDIELGLKCYDTATKLVEEEKLYNANVKELYEQYKNDREILLKKMHDLDLEYCTKLRKTFDIFLGEGACQKIFGNTNRIGMFDDLFEQLIPHFEKMEINIKRIREKIKEKYKENEKDVI